MSGRLVDSILPDIVYLRSINLVEMRVLSLRDESAISAGLIKFIYHERKETEYKASHSR